MKSQEKVAKIIKSLMKSLNKANMIVTLPSQVFTKVLGGRVLLPLKPLARIVMTKCHLNVLYKRLNINLIQPSLLFYFRILKTSTKGQNISVKLHMLEV